MASYFLAVSDVCEQVINVDCFSLVFDPDFMAIIVFYGAHTGLVVQISESPKELPLTGLTAFDSTVTSLSESIRRLGAICSWKTNL